MRKFGIALLLLPFFGAVAGASDRWLMWYDRPAVYWEEALPVGNGRIGAMVYGGVLREHIQLNEETIWSGEPRPASADLAFRELRRLKSDLYFEGRHREAEELGLASDEIRALDLPSPSRVPGTSAARHIYQPLGDLFLHFDHGTAREKNYRRSLDLDSAVATTTYTVGGVRFMREVFASFPADVLVFRVSADQPGAVSFRAALDYREDVENDMYRYDAELGARVESVTTPPRPVWEDLGNRRFSWRGRAHPDGVAFEAHFEVRADGGRVNGTEDGFEVSGADEVTVLMTVGTDYRGAQPADRAAGDLEALAGKEYEALRTEHVSDHRALFRRVDFDLGRNRAADLPTNRRIWAQMAGVTDNRVDQRPERDPALIPLYFQFGRYLMIASSRPGTLPPALQGIWNDSLLPPWFGQHTSDINVQMNYWLAEAANLAECHTALFGLIDTFSEPARASAELSYGVRGQVIHGMTNFGPKVTRGFWPDFSGWLARHYWEHYEFGGDREFLAERAYPFMRECALFYLDTLVRDPDSGKWVTGPTYSPETHYVAPDDNRPAYHDMGVTMSMAICRDVLENTLRAAEVLEVDGDLRREIEEKLADLAPYSIGDDGRLLEWRDDYVETEPGHRHLSHLYSLYPGTEMTPRGTPDLAHAARLALERRIEHNSGWTGWSRAWIVNLAARLGDGALAGEHLRLQLERTTFTNLMNSHPRLGGTTACFQVEGNFGATAAIAEMLLQSHSGEIKLLPALPPEWNRGRITGLRARGGFTVDQEWSGGKLVLATIDSSLGGPCALRTNVPVEVREAGEVMARSMPDRDSYHVVFPTESGSSYTVRVVGE